MVLGIAMLQCRGLTTLWQVLSQALIPARAVPLSAGPSPVSVVAFVDDTVPPGFRAEPEPPPKLERIVC